MQFAFQLNSIFRSLFFVAKDQTVYLLFHKSKEVQADIANF